MTAQTWDVLIVGAGPAGCVLAARLSEDPGRRVLLVEAGPDRPAGAEHADIRDPYPVSLGNPRFSWPSFAAEVGADPGGGQPRFSRQFLQGYGVGGGSNIQGMVAFRGLPEDYDDWCDRGARGWGWTDVLPYFRKLERDLDFAGPEHGGDGPIPVRRIAPQAWAPFAMAVGAAAQRRGYPVVKDLNADFRDGVGPIPMANLPHQRVSASTGYLTGAVRRRPNLRILAETPVERLVLEGRRVAGVVARTRAGVRRIAAHEVIVSAGALHSPALLLRSGIGPAGHLRAMGVDVGINLAGVGRDLQNHAKVDLAVHLPARSKQPDTQRAWGQNCLRYSSNLPDCPPKDMLLAIINKASWHALGRRIGALGVAVYKPFSRGSVELASTDPAAAPVVRFNLLADPRDLERLVHGLRLALELLADPEVAATLNEAFAPDGRIVARLSRRNPGNAMQARAISWLLETGTVRRALLRPAIVDPAALARDEAALRAYVRQRAGLSHHVCATCRMGGDDDPLAVLDSDCRVRGIGGLRVVDASTFPRIPRANTHLPVLMVAEKAADQIKVEGRPTAAARRPRAAAV